MVSIIASLVFGLFVFSNQVMAIDEKIDVFFFYSKSCPHCSQMNPYLIQMANENPEVNLYQLEISIWKNSALMTKVAKELNVDNGGVPFTVIGDEYFVGWSDMYLPKLNQINKTCQQNKCGSLIDLGNYEWLEEYRYQKLGTDDVVILHNKTQEYSGSDLPDIENSPNQVMKLPIYGEVQLSELSLPVITIVIAILDGFNPCAMWVLLFLISLLLHIDSVSKRWFLGMVFIGVSALVYFAFLAAWLNLFMFVGLSFWIRTGIGVLAGIMGINGIYSYIKNPQKGCSSESSQQRKMVFNGLKSLIQQKNIWLTVVGIAGLSVAVNIVELACSAGLPAIYTQILTIQEFSMIKYYAYLLFYTFIFMLDDMLIFSIAMFSMSLVGVESKYARYSSIIGSIVILILGYILIFNPEMLVLR